MNPWNSISINERVQMKIAAKDIDVKLAKDAGVVEYSIECDEHGDIVKVSKGGKFVLEAEYIEIKDPSIAAELDASMKTVL